MNKYIIVSFLAILITVGVSCKKSKENKIVGEWSFVPMRNVTDTGNKQVWNFDASNKLNIEVVSNGAIYTYSGTYNFVKWNKVDIKGIFSNWNGLYKVEKLKNDVLILNRIEKNDESANPDVEGGVFLWKEFTK